MARTPRVLIIGAGPNGLVCAVRLASAGLDVTVLEQGPTPGGGVSSAADTLPGFVHDRCAAFFPLTAASPAFADLGLERHGLRWITPTVAMAHPFADGSAIALHRDLDATVESLERAAPGAGAAWRGVAAPLLANRDLVARTALRRLPPVAPGLLLAARLRRRTLPLARHALGSAATLGGELFGDPRPGAWLCGSVAHSDLSPGAAGGGAFALALTWLGHHVGWPLPEAGAARLTAALVGRLEEAGGRVRCGAPVHRILTRSNRVSGVRLHDGEQLAGDVVVASVSAGPLAAMLADDALPGRLLCRLRGWRYGVGTFKVDWALSGPVPWTAPDARAAGVVHVGDTIENFFRSFEDSRRGEVPETPAMVVGQQSLHDMTRAPQGRHTLYAYARLSRCTDRDPEAVADVMEQRIEAFAPGFGARILARAHRSPGQIERDNPNMVGGDLGGGALELDQQLIFRPAPELVRGRTPLRGLYVGSASVHPGAGVHGVPGAAAAAAVLADRATWRFWR